MTAQHAQRQGVVAGRNVAASLGYGEQRPYRRRAMIVVAWSGSTAIVLAVQVLAGVGWIWVVADLGASIQVFLPAWLQARALTVYEVVLFGCFAGSAAGWGLVAQWFGLPAAFTAAGFCCWPPLSTRRPPSSI
jgi:hypothetical protein